MSRLDEAAERERFRTGLAEAVSEYLSAERLTLSLIALFPGDVDSAALAEWRAGVARAAAGRQTAENVVVAAILAASGQLDVAKPLPDHGFDAVARKASGHWIMLLPAPEPGGRRALTFIRSDQPE